jgi:hypothetical protein
MADETQTPPVGEEIHLPNPSLIPVSNAFGISLVILGLAVGWGVTIFGGVIFLITLVLWIRDARHELNELPLDH